MSINELIRKISTEVYLESDKGKIYLNNLKSIWSYLGLDKTLSQKDLSTINKTILYLNKDIFKVNEYINEMYIDEQSDENVKYVEIFLSLSTSINEKCKIIKDIINSVKNEYILNEKIKYYKKDENIWLENLVNIYLNEGGKLPILPIYFFKYFKGVWKHILQERDRQFIIYVCEDILGGLNLENISYNFYTWLKRNITDIRILNDFYIS